MVTMTEITLPEAPADSYVRWVRWWRRTERKQRAAAGRDARVQLGTDGLSALLPSLSWDIVAREIDEQAKADRGRPTFTPRLRMPRPIVVDGLDYLARSAQVLDGTVGGPQRAEVRELHARVLEQARGPFRARSRDSREVARPRRPARRPRHEPRSSPRARAA
jgi:hypothetical protein